MKTTSACLSQPLLAGLLAVLLLALHGGAHAVEVDGERPLLEQGGPGHFPGGPQGIAPHGHRSGPGPEHAMRAGLPPLGEPGFGAMPPFLHGLDLSIAQQDKVFAILHAQAPTLYEQDKAAARAYDALRSLARAEHYDDAQALALTRDVANAKAHQLLQRVRTEQKLLAILTPEQRKKLAAQTLPPHPLAPQSRP